MVPPLRVLSLPPYRARQNMLAVSVTQACAGVACEAKEFPEMKHGWVTRGDLTKAAVKRDEADAMARSFAFLDRHLPGENATQGA